MWPAGLEPPYLDRDGKSEFILAYYPEDENTTEIMNNVVSKLLGSVAGYTKQKQFIDQGLKFLTDSDFETIKKFTDKVKIFGNFTTKFQAEYQSNPEKFIDKYIKPEVEGFLWNPCLRQTIFNAINTLTSDVICDLGPGIDIASYSKHVMKSSFLSFLIDNDTSMQQALNYSKNRGPAHAEMIESQFKKLADNVIPSLQIWVNLNLKKKIYFLNFHSNLI